MELAVPAANGHFRPAHIRCAKFNATPETVDPHERTAAWHDTVAPNTPVNIAYTTVKADTSAISTGFGTSSSSSTLQGGMENMKAQSSEEMGAKSMNARSSEETGKEIKQQAQDAEELGERAWKVDVPIYETYGKYVARTHGRLPSGARHAAHACVILMTVLIYEGCLANKVAAVLLSVVVHGILWQLDS